MSGGGSPLELALCALIYLNGFLHLKRRSIDVRNRTSARGLCVITKRETAMPKEMPKDPIKRTAEAYERIARSPGGMRIVVETYLRLAKSTSDAQQRRRLLEVAAFYDELAEAPRGRSTRSSH